MLPLVHGRLYRERVRHDFAWRVAGGRPVSFNIPQAPFEIALAVDAHVAFGFVNDAGDVVVRVSVDSDNRVYPVADRFSGFDGVSLRFVIF